MWFERENDENVVRTRDWCGWPSSPHLTLVSNCSKVGTNIFSCGGHFFPTIGFNFRIWIWIFGLIILNKKLANNDGVYLVVVHLMLNLDPSYIYKKETKHWIIKRSVYLQYLWLNKIASLWNILSFGIIFDSTNITVHYLNSTVHYLNKYSTLS